MSNYIFLTENFTENETKYFAIEASKIETLNLSDTYDRFGQKISNSDAGDSITLNTVQAIKYWNEDGDEDYDENAEAIGESITAFDYPNSFDKISSLLIEGEDFTSNKETVKGFNYWDGSNYKTITIQVENGEPSHTILDDEKLIAELNEAIENKKFVKEGFGTKIYEANGWTVEDNYCQGEWSSFRVYTPNSEN